MAQCREWRELCKQLRPQYRWLDPVDEAEVATLTDNGLASRVPPGVIFARDLRSVRQADIVLANINTFGQPRPPIGTISEIAWAFMLGKPVLIYAEPSPLLQHPFLIKQSAFIGSELREVLAHLDYIAKGA
jgi:nucleoside 2-deoxyribosyltransferase